jgi:hypothetical protein
VPDSAGARRGRLDPDEAWDARVGQEAYYEEQELGLHAPAANTTAYGGGGYAQGASPYGGYDAGFGGQQERGRSRERELDARYDEEMHGERRGRSPNPFGDTAEPSNISLRGVSPRPIDTTVGQQGQRKDGDSPTERRSMFREDV